MIDQDTLDFLHPGGLASYSSAGDVADDVVHLGGALLWSSTAQGLPPLLWGAPSLTVLWDQPEVVLGGSVYAHLYRAYEAAYWRATGAAEVAFGGAIGAPALTWDAQGSTSVRFRSVDWSVQGSSSCWFGGLWICQGSTKVTFDAAAAAAPGERGFEGDGYTDVQFSGRGGVPGSCISGDSRLNLPAAVPINYVF